MRMGIGAGIGVCVAIAAACSEAEGPGTVGHTLSDSAGIELVTNHAPRWSSGEIWQVSERPAQTIGEVDGPLELLFGTVRAVGWLNDGRIFVADEQAHAIRIFSAGGEYLETIGREGGGPGEFRSFGTVDTYRGDSLYVYDYGLGAVNVFGHELSFVRRFSNPVVLENYQVHGALADGRFLLYTPGHDPVAGGPGIVPDTSLIIVMSPDGSVVDTIGAFEIARKNVDSNGRDLGLHLRPYGAFAAAGDRIIWSEGRVFEYVEADPNGTVRRIVRKAHEPVIVTDDIIADYKTQQLRMLEAEGPEGLVAWLRRSLEEMEYYPQLPATSDVKIDALGNVWVGRHHFSWVPTEEWEVFDTAGVWLGSVETPPGLEVHGIGLDRVIGVAKDELNVLFVQVHRLDRR